MAKVSGKKSFLVGAIAGGVIGSVTALLLAPKSGRELRKDIADGTQVVSEHTVRIAGQVGDSTTRIAKQVSGGVTVAASKAKETASTVLDNVRSWRQAGKEEVEEVLDDAGDLVQEAGEAVQDKVEELTQDRKEELQTIS
ncbi:YtxH domain-containing protein [Paenibacillus sp. BC26]|uniref:YtxH domain-containing protein n=1 Tax=Paenibacillus sp. BC26 TaxID=1881032 RepID=UPI0008E7C478|nr:YtxH domain-containing protein [Paenibacillus sp. BC26]SFS58001.1 Gas vesicle protein [Paenibacillus sp. BC26]